jgi:hypothetical protein
MAVDEDLLASVYAYVAYWCNNRGSAEVHADCSASPFGTDSKRCRQGKRADCTFDSYRAQIELRR